MILVFFSNKVNSSFTLMNTMIGIYSGPGFVAMAALATLPLQRRINAGSQQGGNIEDSVVCSHDMCFG